MYGTLECDVRNILYREKLSSEDCKGGFYSGMGSHLRVLYRGATQSDFHFNRVTVLRRKGNKGTIWEVDSEAIVMILVRDYGMETEVMSTGMLNIF